MQKFNTKGIVLARTNYGEADRIITFLTPDRGKVKVIAKGVRKQKSKLAGGIELFSVSDIGVMVGRGEVDTLLSSRLDTNYGNIVKELARSNLAYDIIKKLNKATEEQPEEAYFNLLRNSFAALDDTSITPELIEAWFGAQLLKLSGHAPNLTTQKTGEKLEPGEKYDFDYDSMCFQPGKSYSSNDIKLMRLFFSSNPPALIQKIETTNDAKSKIYRLIRTVSGAL